MSSIEIHIVPQNFTENIRMQEYCIGLFDAIPTKNAVKKAIKKALLMVDDNPTSTAHWVRPGERISYRSAGMHFTPCPIKIDVYYEDEDLAIVKKPAGLETSNNRHRNLLHALPANLQPCLKANALPFPIPVHRLDYATEGLVVIAKNHTALRHLQTLFIDRKVVKKYKAIASGSMSLSGSIDFMLDDKDCLTDYELIAKIDHPKAGILSYIDVSLHTGRKHQIRKHLAMIGHPVIGDKKYNTLETQGFRGLFLVADHIALSHPETGVEIMVKMKMPKKFNKLLERYAHGKD